MNNTADFINKIFRVRHKKHCFYSITDGMQAWEYAVYYCLLYCLIFWDFCLESLVIDPMMVQAHVTKELEENY